MSFSNFMLDKRKKVTTDKQRHREPPHDIHHVPRHAHATGPVSREGHGSSTRDRWDYKSEKTLDVARCTRTGPSLEKPPDLLGLAMV